MINGWHLLHHVPPLKELATFGLKHKIDYTQSRTQPRSKLKHACISKDDYQKVGALVEHAVKVILCGCLVTVDDDIVKSSNTLSWHVGQPLLCCLSFEIWLLPKGRHREGEGDRMDGYFCIAPSPKVWQQKMAPKQSK
jgi:hypothetical protein